MTAGLDTVAVRISSHPVFAEIIGAFGKPLAAPSANRFGRVSPTTAQHVRDELDGRIPLIVDAGPTAHGIESTIVAVRDGKIHILRRGPVTTEQLSKFGEDRHRGSDWKSLRAGTIAHALRAENAAPFDRRCRIIFARRESAGRLTGVESDQIRKRFRRGSLLKRAARFSRGRRESISLFARAGSIRSRSYRCGTSSSSRTRGGDNGSAATRGASTAG